MNEATDYNSLFLSVEFLFREVKEDLISDKVNIKSKRLLDSCYHVISSTKHTNILLGNVEKSYYDLKEEVINYYSSSLSFYEVFEKEFQEIHRKQVGFIPCYNYNTRWLYHKELSKIDLNDIMLALVYVIFDGSETVGYTPFDEDFYFYHIDITDYKNKIDTDEIFRNTNNYGLPNFYDCVYELLYNMQYDDIFLFMCNHRDKRERLDYLDCLGYDLQDYFYECLDLTENDLNELRNE